MQNNPVPSYRQTAESFAYVDARGSLTAETIGIAQAAFKTDGAVHIGNTEVTSAEQLLPLLAALGFGADEQFTGGGRTAAAWQQKWAAPGLRRLDFYPPHLYLLPNGEIHYQRVFPQRILFYCQRPANAGGRTYIHSAKALQRQLARTATGRQLLEKLAQHGLMIETGFLDANHPGKSKNYHQSWQERFRSDNKVEALAAAQAQSDEYDSCWWQENSGYSTLMTRLVLPAFVAAPDGEEYMRFPRIAMDAAEFHNGYRRFPLGNGVELSDTEKMLLRSAYLQTQSGYDWQRGDIILMDNIRCAHSREPFTGPRDVWLGMAGKARI
ncbi:MAG: TauD/TfdA family dioxygenase [Micavibrio sp.]|nr:TauD/TfdA family dioxygenase [Micavibrio sp.]